MKFSAAMKPAGGCPFAKEAVQRLRPFASSCINRSNYTNLNDKIFFREIDKLDHNDIALLPVVIGRGIAIATVGLNKNDFEGKTRQSICDSIPHVMAAFISRFPEIGTLFERKLLSDLEKTTLVAFTQSGTEKEVSEALGLSEHTISRILDIARNKLCAKNRIDLGVKAMIRGELGQCFKNEQSI